MTSALYLAFNPITCPGLTPHMILKVHLTLVLDPVCPLHCKNMNSTVRWNNLLAWLHKNGMDVGKEALLVKLYDFPGPALPLRDV